MLKTERDAIGVRVGDCATGMCPSWLLNAKLEKVVSSFTESLDKMDAAEATRNTCSKAEACLEESGGTFQMR